MYSSHVSLSFQITRYFLQLEVENFLHWLKTVNQEEEKQSQTQRGSLESRNLRLVFYVSSLFFNVM